MQKNYFLFLKKLKNTGSAQLWRQHTRQKKLALRTPRRKVLQLFMHKTLNSSVEPKVFSKSGLRASELSFEDVQFGPRFPRVNKLYISLPSIIIILIVISQVSECVATIPATLKFTVKDCDPTTGEPG